MTTEKNRQILLASRPHGEPSPDNFKLVETAVPDPGRQPARGHRGGSRRKEPRLVLDTVGGTPMGELAKSLKTGGLIVIYGIQSGQFPAISPKDFVFRGLSLHGFWLIKRKFRVVDHKSASRNGEKPGPGGETLKGGI